MIPWSARVAAAGSVALGTDALLYFLDRTEPYYPLVAEVLALAEDGEIAIVVPALAETELLVGLMRSRDTGAQARLGLLLDHFPGLSVVPLDRAAARSAAHFRATLGLAQPAALLVGTAVVAGCGAVIGNDPACAARMTKPEYLHLAEFAPGVAES